MSHDIERRASKQCIRPLLERIKKFKKSNRNVRSVRSNFLLTAPISCSRLAENSPAAGDLPKRHKWRQFTVFRLGFIDWSHSYRTMAIIAAHKILRINSGQNRIKSERSSWMNVSLDPFVCNVWACPTTQLPNLIVSNLLNLHRILIEFLLPYKSRPFL